MIRFLNIRIFALLAITLSVISCNSSEKPKEAISDKDSIMNDLKAKIAAYSPTEITADVSHLDERKKKVLQLLVEAGKIADEIFWKQTTPDGIQLREKLKAENTEEAKLYLQYLNINYGPYDFIYENRRFYGDGPISRPPGGTFYPLDITKEEFENYITQHPQQKNDLTGLYTVVERDGDKLKSVPYSKAYPEIEKLASKLDEAANYADNAQLKRYLTLRAKALRTDDYFESDMAWMDLKDSDIDVVIGPIESYEDELMGQKTAFECMVMVKDMEASKELKMFETNINEFEKRLPYDKKYIRPNAGSDNILQVVNVAYFGGQCQKGTKTIAASLPNDPKVHKLKGGKKSMFKNLMEAKFDKIILPISKVMVDSSLQAYVDKTAFTSFVTLHEVSHTLGRGYVFGNDTLSVQSVLKDKYSSIEECKADITGIYNIKHLFDMKLVDELYVKKMKATYLAGLYRSIRFGLGAHGTGNLIQMNFLLEKGAIIKQANGTLNINDAIFFDKVGELAGIILTIQAEGDYTAASDLIKKYGVVTPEIKNDIEKLKSIPRDLDCKYAY